MSKTLLFLLAASFAALLAVSCFDSDDDEDLPGSNLTGSGDSSSSEEASSSSAGVVYGESVDYGGETYQTVVIGSQTWFARNLNYDAEGSRCYNDLESNCDIYGRLYDWETALAVCPSGWHLPGEEEWDELILYVDSTYNTNISQSFIASEYLRTIDGWNNNSIYNSTDKYGFSALPGGRGLSDGSFSIVGVFGFWWSATESDFKSDYALCRVMGVRFFGEPLNDDGEGCPKFSYASIRCLKN